MGQAYIMRRGGGGAGLNFTVVGGTTQPASPKENTIWINTSTAITSWQFSPTQPSTAPDGTALKTGDVWIKTGVSSSMSFDMLKKNTVEIFIVGCYLWDGSSFVEKTVKGYINGGWVSTTIYLFTNGSAQVTWTMHRQSGEVTAGVSNGLLYFGEKFDSAVNSGNGSYHTPLIDITNVSYIYFNVNNFSRYSNSNFNPVGYISKTANEYSNTSTKVATVSLTSTGLKTLDVRNFTGTYYIGIAAWNTYNGESWSYVYLDNIYMI